MVNGGSVFSLRKKRDNALEMLVRFRESLSLSMIGRSETSSSAIPASFRNGVNGRNAGRRAIRANTKTIQVHGAGYTPIGVIGFPLLPILAPVYRLEYRTV